MNKKDTKEKIVTRSVTQTITAGVHHCKSCGNTFTLHYCNACGEKKHHPEDRKLHHVLHEGFHFLTHFEGSFFRTLRIVFVQPGKLSDEFCNGIRKKYFKPISFFLFTVILYLLFSGFQGLNMQFATYVDKDYSFRAYALEPARQKMRNKGLTETALAEKYDAKSPKIAKVMLLLLIPLSALVLYALYYRSRPFYFDHFILATEITAMYVLSNFVLFFLVSELVWLIYPPGKAWFFDDSILWVLIRVAFMAWVVVAVKKFYGNKWSWSMLKAFIFTASFYIGIIAIYDVVLYFTVLLFI